MRKLGYRSGHGRVDEPVTEPKGSERVMPEAVVRTDLRRSRQAAFGSEPHPQAALFAARLSRAVADAPGGRPAPVDDDWIEDDRQPTLPALRDAVFGDGAPSNGVMGHGTRTDDLLGEPVSGGTISGVAGLASGPETLQLPTDPTLLYDRCDRIVHVNPALLELADARPDGPDLLGMRVTQLVTGPDDDARLVRADGSPVRVRVIRWDLPDDELTAAVLVELDGGAAAHPGDLTWTAELERLARVGTWSFELSTGTLQRSDTLEELYRSVGLDPEPDGAGPLEGEQIALLCRGLRSGVGTGDHHVELRLPGGRLLSCRAEVERAANGEAVRLVGVVRDLTEQRLTEGRVRHSGQRFADLMAVMPGGVLVIDAAGRVVDANMQMGTLLGVPVERLRGVPAAALAAERAPDAEELPDWLRMVPPGARHGYRVEATPLLRGDNTTVWCELAVTVTAADDGSRFWLVVCTDIAERRRAAEVLRNAGTVDELTRLPNRAACLEMVDRLLAGPGRERVAVVCGDLDDFQRVNSSLGHEAGDDLLVTLAARLQRELPVGCTAARLSGDEFVVICADHAEVGGPDMLAQMVADLLRTTITVHGRPVQMTASVGLAMPVPSGDVRAADLLRFAEVAMHDAKRRQSRGGIGMATDGVVSSATKLLELEAELRAAIASDALVLDYQPVVGPDGTVLSAEALVRWPHPERGLISPAEFLPVAQRSGLLRELDLWVLRTAVREAVTWPAFRDRKPAVAVNLAGLLPADIDFLHAVTNIVEGAGLPWGRLVLELVETSLVALPPCAHAAMAELVSRGVRFAVDDFGTGYSSLARLKELPAQTVKIDRAFVTGVSDDPADFAVASAVVDMARAMGRTTVAEGVETAEQFHVLRGIGVDAYQGWLFSRALAPSALHDVLAKGKLATPASAAASQG